MKTVFSGKLYLQTVKRIRALGIAMLVCICLLNIFLPIMGISRNAVKYDTYATYEDPYASVDAPPAPRIQTVEDLAFAPFLYGLLLFAPLLVYAAFSYLHERKQADFFHALPKTRVCVYLSTLAAVMTWIVGTVLISVLINTGLWSFAKYSVFSAVTVLGNVVYYTVLSAFFASFMAVAMMVTGTGVSAVLAFLFLAFVPRYALMLFKFALEEQADILVHTHDILPLLDPDRWILIAWWDGFAQDGFFSDPAVLCYSLAVAVALFTAAGVLYHIRRSESAGKSAPTPVLQHVYRILFTSAAAILLPYAILYDGFDDYVLLLLLMIPVVYMLYELMTVKRVGSMLRSLKLLWVPFAVCVAFACSVLLARAYVYSVRVEADKVEYVTFDGTVFANDSYGDRLLYLRTHDAPEVIGLCTDALGKVLDGVHSSNEQESVTITFHLKNGKAISRYLHVPSGFWNEVRLSKACRDEFFTLPSGDALRRAEIVPMPLPEDGTIGGRYAEMTATILDTYRREYEALSDYEKLMLIGLSTQHVNRLEGSYIRMGTRIVNERYGATWEEEFKYLITPEFTPETEALLCSLYGTDEEILAYLQGLKAESFLDDVTVAMLSGDGFSYRYTDTEEFFRCVAVNSHLFTGTGNTLVHVKGLTFWVNLTEEERRALLSPNEEPLYDYEITVTAKAVTVNGGSAS